MSELPDPLLPTTPLPTPSQTVGPFYGYALPFPSGGEPAPAGHPDAVIVHGRVLDGSGDPIPDAVLEIWQPGPDGSRSGVPGSMRRDPVTGGFAGRDPAVFTGFARIATDADGHWTLRTLLPGGVPYLSVCVFARGLLHHLFTRIYLPDAGVDGDPVLASVDPQRRGTLLAAADGPARYRFDLRLQGPDETVFLEFG